MSAGHFFIGLGAGIAILAVPVLTLTPVPQRVVGWIEGPPPAPPQIITDNAAAQRPVRGYQPGAPTPATGPGAPPTLQPIAVSTPAPQAQAPLPQSLADARWARTGVIRSGGAPVYVRQQPGMFGPADPQIAEGSPVLIADGGPQQVGDRQWLGIHGLNGITGWVEATQVAGDNQRSTQVATAEPAATPTTPAAQAERATIANTGGEGVVLRNSPNDADRSRSGLMDGMAVTVLERSGADWVRVRADNGQEGWVPAQYVTAASGG
jgi:SH3-like domain-containing protein